MQLQGATFWLIGASEGIGRALALELATRGARLAVTARNHERIASLVTELQGENHIALAADVTDPASLAQRYQQVRAYFGACDAVIFNAGVYTPMTVGQWNLAQAQSTMNINFNGALHMLDAVLPDFLAKQAGRLVLVSSVAAYRGLPKSLAYGASKAALTNLAESLRIELECKGIKVQLVSPGFVKTRLTAQNDFPMPFAISAEDAAKRIANGIANDNYEIHFPKRFSLFMKLLRVLPNRIFFTLARAL
jgi:short-subunit dehydrogenase